jgi:hypothetical protein
VYTAKLGPSDEQLADTLSSLPDNWDRHKEIWKMTVVSFKTAALAAWCPPATPSNATPDLATGA